MVISTQISDRQFLENEQSKPGTSRKTTTVFGANDKIRAFLKKLDF